MKLYEENIKKLNLPEQHNSEKHINYVKRVLLTGRKLNTRQCRFIGIGNLHSIISALSTKHFPHTVKHRKVVDPYTGEVPPYEVDVIWMTPEQIQTFKQQNAQPKLSD